MKLYSMSSSNWSPKIPLNFLFQSSLWSYILCPAKFNEITKQYTKLYFNLLYEAIFYVLKGSWIKEFTGNILFQSSLWSYILCPSKIYILKSLGSKIFQSSLWSYILCPIQYVHHLLFPLFEFQSSLWSYILCPIDFLHWDYWKRSMYFNLLYEAIFYVLWRNRLFLGFGL